MKLFLFIFLFLSCVYGLPHIYKSDETESSTTSTTNQLKLNFTFSTQSNDENYIITWTAEMHASTLATYISVCLMCDGMVLNEQEWDPNGPVGGGWAVASGWKYSDLDAGNHEFTLWYRSGALGQTVKIRRARIMATPVNAVIM